MKPQRFQIIVQGQVQGVGFRPQVYRVAHQLNLTGWVKNTAIGVFIEVQGKLAVHFLEKLTTNLPPLAKISDIQTKTIEVKINEASFEILASVDGANHALIPPDTCICPNCLKELFDPQSRYYRYPFLNCTQCGPRLTITRDLPYDRCQTSMDVFPLCDACHRDYVDPENRRYHAQPTACVKCGPQLSMSLQEIVKKIREGEIIALKGMGGYQLICDASNESAVSRLRTRKNRDAKPFALMLANIQSAKKISNINEHEEVLLKSSARPIVLLKKNNFVLPQAIASKLSTFGIMLPSTPLHYLLFNALVGYPDGLSWLEEEHPFTLIVTSANLGGNPLIVEDDMAEQELKNVADSIISYNRKIITRVDDSVMCVMNDTPFFIRRARGFVPTPILLPHAIPSTLAVGGYLKNTFCITRGNEAFVSQHIGSLNNRATIDFFHESLTHLLRFLNVTPERIAHDMHPDFYTTRFAESYGIPRFPIQHHHAHLASVAAEHHIQSPVLGLALDGYGYGIGGEAWGGELLLLNEFTFQRLGNFAPLPQPGGDMAAREPWRMAAAVLTLLERSNEICVRFSNYSQAHLITQLLEKQINCPMTSSCGRLFDAASALLGIQMVSQYEGQAAMYLESLVTYPEVLPNGWSIHQGKFNMMNTLKFLAECDHPITGANIFHGTLIAGLASWIKATSQEQDIETILLSGGCFLNKVLTEGLIQALNNLGIKALLPLNLPPNDGGISLGQAWISGQQ